MARMLVTATRGDFAADDMSVDTGGEFVQDIRSQGLSAVEFIGVTLLFLPVFAANLGVRW